MAKPAVVVSDLHLGAVPTAVRDDFVDFTRHWRGRTDLLLINGDLFDFWFEYRSAVPSQHFQVLRALADLRESGVRIVLIGGNHDAWGGPFLEGDIGIELFDGPLELSLSGRRAFVAHGDGLGPGDLGYKLLKRTLRSRVARGAMRLIHPDLAQGIAGRVSRTHERRDPTHPRVQERARVLEDFAVELLRSRTELDLVVLGHCHVPQVRRVDDRGYYVNSGDWVVHRTCTVVDADGIRQFDWRGSG